MSIPLFWILLIIMFVHLGYRAFHSITGNTARLNKAAIFWSIFWIGYVFGGFH